MSITIFHNITIIPGCGFVHRQDRDRWTYGQFILDQRDHHIDNVSSMSDSSTVYVAEDSFSDDNESEGESEGDEEVDTDDDGSDNYNDDSGGNVDQDV